MKSRPYIIVGNWKMYKTIDQALSFIDEIATFADSARCQVWLAVPFTAIKSCSDRVKGTKILIGAQNMNDAKEGAFTGEVAASMLRDAGADFVILGHSERRKVFAESDEFINCKVKRAIESNLKFILCIGETFDEREQGKTEEVLKRQLEKGLASVKAESVANIHISYEPVWAIGTGKAAMSEMVEEAHSFCRKVLTELLGEAAAKKIPLLYGGSVNPDNANNFLAEPDVDGLLIGSASLQAESFAKIIKLLQNSPKTTVEIPL